jgi:hypothetical protein
MKMPAAGALILVDWQDVSSCDNWCDPEKAAESARADSTCLTVAWFYKERDGCIEIVSTAHFRGDKIHESGTMYRIPVGCIQNNKVLPATGIGQNEKAPQTKREKP